MIFRQKWEGRRISEGGYFPATVPGNIQYDYGVAHGFADVQFSDNYKQYLPLENDAWEYMSHLSFEKKEGERVFFVSGGIDYKYDISLNGNLVYSYEGMFKPVEADITDALTEGDNVLTVYIYPHPKRAGAPKGTRDEADESCKPPVCYGWDWNPRLLISGMWQDAYIETRDSFYIGHCNVTSSLGEDMREGFAEFSFDCEKPCSLSLYDREGALVWQGDSESVRRAEVKDPELWWCNGQGEAYLYRWEIKNEREVREGYIGFRRIRLVRNFGEKGPSAFPKTRYAPPATFELNGRKILAKGSNWVNPDIFWGRIDREHYDSLLCLAKDANMNILRMWGGASVAKDVFYELCDRYGILVWQEFMLACNNYKGSPHYLSVLESEATYIIKDLRTHPCLALWCGGNELFNSWSGMDDQSLPLRLLGKLCYEHDRDTPFIPTSPLMGMAHGGYRFYIDKQDCEVHQQFQVASNTAYTEFGVPSMSSVETLERIIPKEELFPITDTAAWVAHHGFDAWGKPNWVCMDVIERYFGKPASLRDAVDNSSWLQSAGYQEAFEEMRRQWPHCGMMLNWCYNEPWMTAANNSIIEYPARPKPSYEFVKRAMRPTIFSARIKKFLWREGELFEAELWLLNDAPVSVEGKVVVSIKIGEYEKELLEWSGEAEPNLNCAGPTVRCVLPATDSDRLVLTLRGENGMENSYCLRYDRVSAPASTVRMLNV